MLYINNELLNTSNQQDTYAYADLVKEYYETIKKAQEYYGEFLNIETSIRPRRDEKTRALRYPGPRGLLLISNIKTKLKDGNTSMVELRYSPNILEKDGNGKLKHNDPNFLINRGVYSFRITDNQDFAFYALKCGKVGRTPAEGKKFHFYDKASINKSNHDFRQLQGQILNLIYSSLPENKLRTLAKSFGVGDVNLKDVVTIREELFEILSNAEDRKAKNPESKDRGFKEFIESAEVRFHDQITALCVDARESEALVYNEDERRWEIDYKDGGKPYILKELSGNEFGDPMGSLVSYLIDEQNALRKLEGVMGLAKKEEIPTEKDELVLTAEMILKEHKVPTLKKWLKQLDPEIVVKKDAKGQFLKEELLKRIPTE